VSAIQGRLLVREGHVQGLFMPTKDHTLKPGLYSVTAIPALDLEPQLRFIGEPAMPTPQLGARAPSELAHAQAEIQDYARAMKSFTAERFPWVMEVYEESRNAG